MSAIGDLVVNLVAKTRQFTEPLGGALRDLQGFVGRSGSLLSVVGALTAGLSVAGAVTWGGSLAVEAEQAQIAFTTMLQSADAARTLLGELSQFAATTPYESPEVTAAAKQLLAYGISAERVIPTLRQLGDVASGVGAPIGDIAYLFGTAAVQGRLFTADINQFTNRGIPIITALAKTMGVAEGSVKKLVESGQVGFPELQAAFEYLTGQGSRFGGMMEQQSRSVGGLWSSLKDNLGMTLRAIAEEMFAAFDLRGVLKSSGEALGQMSFWMQSHRSELQAVAAFVLYVAKVVGVLGAAVLAYTAAQRAATIASIVFQAVTNPASLIKIGLALAGAAAAVYVLDQNLKSAGADAAELKAQASGITTEANAAAEATKRIGEGMAGGGGDQLTRLLGTLREWRSLRESGAAGARDTFQNAITLGLQFREPLFGDTFQDAEKQAKSLRDALAQVKAAVAGGVIPASYGADFTRQIEQQLGSVSGITAAITESRAELSALGAADPQKTMRLQQFADKGATAEQVRELDELLTKLDAAKQAQDALRASQEARNRGLDTITALKDEIDVLTGAATQAQIELRKLERSGIAPDQLAEIERLQAERDRLRGVDDQQSQGGRRDNFAAAVSRGSAEAVASIVRGQTQTPTKKLEDIAAKQLKAQEQTVASLEKLTQDVADAPQLIANY